MLNWLCHLHELSATVRKHTEKLSERERERERGFIMRAGTAVDNAKIMLFLFLLYTSQ
jgi:hypothetical protein